MGNKIYPYVKSDLSQPHTLNILFAFKLYFTVKTSDVSIFIRKNLMNFIIFSLLEMTLRISSTTSDSPPYEDPQEKSLCSCYQKS